VKLLDQQFAANTRAPFLIESEPNHGRSIHAARRARGEISAAEALVNMASFLTENSSLRTAILTCAKRCAPSSGHDVQTAVDVTHHLIVAHEVTNVGNDRSQLTNMAVQARVATGIKDLTVVADRGYFKSKKFCNAMKPALRPSFPNH